MSRRWECLKYWNSDGMWPLCYCYLLFQIWIVGSTVDSALWPHSWLLSPGLSLSLSLSPDNLCWQEPSSESRELPNKIGSYHPEIVVSYRLKLNCSDTFLTNEANNAGKQDRKSRPARQAVKVKVVARFETKITRLARTERDQCAQTTHVTRLTLMRGVRGGGKPPCFRYDMYLTEQLCMVVLHRTVMCTRTAN